MTIAALLFDLDGVLVDSRVPIARSMNHALRQLGFDPEPEPVLHDLIGPPLHDAFELLLARRGADPSQVQACVEAYREVYGELALAETRLVAGMDDLIERLGSRRLAVATSKPARFARPILAGLNLLDRFEVVVGPSLDARGEPKTVTVRRALAALGLGNGGPPSLLIGDRHHDVSAGRAHGLLTVGVTWGIGGRAELEEARVDYLVETPVQLASLVEQIERGAAGRGPST